MHRIEDKEEELERLKNSFLYQYTEIQEREKNLRFWKARLNNLLKTIRELRNDIEIEDE